MLYVRKSCRARPAAELGNSIRIRYLLCLKNCYGLCHLPRGQNVLANIYALWTVSLSWLFWVSVCTKRNQSGARVHAECNCVLHSARPHGLHSAGGPYITSIAKQMDEGFAGTKLYGQRACFFLTPLSVSLLYQHIHCEFIYKVDYKNIFLHTWLNWCYSIIGYFNL
jgi:hypothetical protein